jgi:hypothetical protein
MGAQLSNPLVYSPVLALNQFRLNPTGDRGEDLAGLLLRDSADLANLGSLKLLGQFREYLAPIDALTRTTSWRGIVITPNRNVTASPFQNKREQGAAAA